MNRLPADDEAEQIYNRLHRAGWSIGEVKHGSQYLVTGTKSENRIHASGDFRVDAWRLALEQAKAVGMAGK